MQISDDLLLGSAYIGGSFTPNVTTSGNAYGVNPSPMTVGVGPMGRIFCFDIVPAAVGTTTGINQLAAGQTTAGAGNLTLTAGTGVTATVDASGTTRYVMDCARTVMFYSSADLHLINVTVRGYDQYGQAMSQTIAGPNAGTVETTKCFKSITSIAVDAAVGTAIYAGLGNGIGLPFRLTDLGYVVSCMFNQTAITISSTAVKVADTTSPATTTTTDVRGYVVTASADATKRLVVNYMLPAIASGPNATRIGAAGVTQA